MKEHLLLQKAYIYPLPKSTLEMDGYQFDCKNGYWVTKVSGRPLVLDKSNSVPRSKKCDIETGEDQKGE